VDLELRIYNFQASIAKIEGALSVARLEKNYATADESSNANWFKIKS
jgi:hypothetical protein